jgi:hypothetical protein
VNKNRRKLSLSKETIVQLSGADLRRVAAGEAWSDASVCPTVTPSDCRSCNAPKMGGF